MIQLYGLRDVHANAITHIDLFPNDFVAYREYYLSIEKARQNNPAILHEDYEIVHLANMTEDFHIDEVRKIVTKEYILENMPNLSMESK